MKKILLIDDEQLMLNLLELYLVPAGYSCVKCTDGNEAADLIASENPALVILDIMMPDKSGFDICREIRLFSDIPIIMVTARDHKADIVKGLRAGADDYLTKPFDESELLARIEAILRRTRNNPAIEFRGLKWDENKQEAVYREKTIPFTPKEFRLAGLFLQNRNRVFDRDHLITAVWGYEADTDGRTVDSHVRHIRDKLRKTGFPVEEHLQTVWGAGYKWTDEKK
ncbi:response regulator transcription factor [Metabacillus indicus]|uniref:response regulator transcription factor n=1 Tax=Metabacillus indicus TaxID=246786 RepID=UPI00248F472F|nr:response regulator transcription factor [Metabacillus indicus]